MRCLNRTFTRTPPIFKQSGVPLSLLIKRGYCDSSQKPGNAEHQKNKNYLLKIPINRNLVKGMGIGAVTLLSATAVVKFHDFYPMALFTGVSSCAAAFLLTGGLPDEHRNNYTMFDYGIIGCGGIGIALIVFAVLGFGYEFGSFLFRDNLKEYQKTQSKREKRRAHAD